MTSLVSTEVVRDVAERLASVDVDVMPIKGALLQHWLYDDPADRPMTDVDVLVRPSSLHLAVRVLAEAGYRPLSRSSIGAHVLRSPHHIAVDLHPRLFDRARYRLPADAVFARSAVDDTLFGTRVRVPSQLDAYAHLIGKFGSDHGTASSVLRLDEIARMGRALRESSERIARHLVDTGMRRVSRYVLPLVAAAGDPGARATWAALPRDPIGAVAVSLADAMLRSAPSTWPVSSVAAHLLNHSLPSTARSGARALQARRGA